MALAIFTNDQIETGEVVDLYKSNGWSSAEKPEKLLLGLRNSHCLVTARLDGKLIGLANAISDGHLVVYFPHLLIAPELQRQGIGRKIMQVMLRRYAGFHQLMLTADDAAVDFYGAMGFTRAGRTEPMWIYGGSDH